MADDCFGNLVMTETRMKCLLCSAMMTRKMYDQWCLRGYTQYHLQRSGFQSLVPSTAPILPQFHTCPVLRDLAAFTTQESYQTREQGQQVSNVSVS